MQPRCNRGKRCNDGALRLLVEWLDVELDKGPTDLTRVRRDPEHNFNRNSMYCFWDDCEAYNVALMSTVPDDDDCDMFEVVSKCGRQAA